MADMQELIARLEDGPVYLTHKEAYDLAIFFGSDTALGLASLIRKAFAGGSLDAALALAERVLDQPYPWVGKNRGSPMVAAWSCELVMGDDFRAPAIETDAETPALALCIAILKAKAQGEGG